MGLEQPIPEIEVIAEKVPYITPGRVVRKLSVDFLKSPLSEPLMSHGFFPTIRVRGLMTFLKDQPQAETTPGKMVLDHLFPVRSRLFMVANKKAHPDMWMRDYTYTSEFTASIDLDDNVLETFESRQRRNGQIPTAVGILGSTPWHFADDESTMLYILTAANLIKQDPAMRTPQRQTSLEKAFEFVNKHVYGGRYVTPAGERRGWHDAFIFPQSDVITYCQGIYTVTLMALNNLGFNIPIQEMESAKQQYVNLAQEGYLPLSAKFNQAPDASCLYPEYLAITRFSDSMLSDSLVKDTIGNLPRSKHGIKILTTSPKGDCFDPSYFVTGYEKGDYQNGGVWPLWHGNVLLVGELHGVLDPSDKNYRQDLLTLLDTTNWPEYIKSGGEFEKILTPRRPHQVWDAAIPAQFSIANKLISGSQALKFQV